jgi:hypothetical protein
LSSLAPLSRVTQNKPNGTNGDEISSRTTPPSPCSQGNMWARVALLFADIQLKFESALNQAQTRHQEASHKKNQLEQLRNEMGKIESGPCDWTRDNSKIALVEQAKTLGIHFKTNGWTSQSEKMTLANELYAAICKQESAITMAKYELRKINFKQKMFNKMMDLFSSMSCKKDKKKSKKKTPSLNQRQWSPMPSQQQRFLEVIQKAKAKGFAIPEALLPKTPTSQQGGMHFV